MPTDPNQWSKLPGNWDTLHTDQLFPSSNPYGIPDLKPVSLYSVPEWLVGYRTRVRSDQGFQDGCVHFFLNDHVFETTWSAPGKSLRYLRKFSTLLTPDFSLYPGWPPILQQWNVYRSRWCGAFWQDMGFTVIPTLTWGDENTFDFVFEGVPQRSLVAVNVVGTYRRRGAKSLFLNGFEAMIQRLQPSLVLCYGNPHAEMFELASVRAYPDAWHGVNGARKIARKYK